MSDSKQLVLLAEDSKSIQLAMTQALESSFNVHVIVAEDFAQALAVLAGQGPKLFLAILDLALPGAMNGEVVDHAIRLGVPSLVFTSTFDDATRRGIMSKGVLDYVVKRSGSVEEVVRIVQRLQVNRERKILIVDDSAATRDRIRSDLTAYGFQVLTAGSGKAALDILSREEGVDLVITDFKMPEMDGVQLTQVIRRGHSRKDMAVIGMSSASKGSTAARFLKYGASDFLHKPFSREELYCRVINIVEVNEQHRRAANAARSMQELEEQQRQLIENAPIGIFRSSPTGQFLLANTHLAKMYGYESAQELIDDVWDIGVQLYVDAAERVIVRNSLGIGPINTMEVRRRRKDGSIIWVALSMRSVHDATGELAYYEGFSVDITQMKRAEEVLQASARMQRSIIDSIDAGIVLIDPKTHVIDAINATAANMFGAPAEAIIGKVCHECLCPAEVDCCPITDFSQEIERSERVLLKSDGKRLAILKTVKRIELGGRVLLLESFMDISERKRAEVELTMERTRLENIIIGTGVGTWEWNVQTGETIFNDRWASIVGYTLDELSPLSIKTWKALAHPEDLVLSAQLLERHFSGELDAYEGECRLRHKDGHWVWVLDRGRLISRTPDGKPLMMYGTHMDITARKVEQQLLQESEEQYRSFFDSTEAIRLLIDSDTGVIENANRAAELFYGYPSGRLRGMNISEINRLPPDKVRLEWGQAASLEKSHFQFQHRIADGSVRDVEVYTSVVRNQGRSFIMSSIHDISELKRLERVKLEVDQIMRHDLKSPLAGFITVPSLLLEDENLTPDQRELLALLGASGKKMLGQINSALELYRIEEGHYVPKHLECRPMLLIQGIIGMLSISRRVNRGAFHLADHTGDSGRGGGGLYTDPLLLELVLTNLIGNALDASGPEDWITIDASEEGQDFRITIHNRQPVAEELRDRFFEKYTTAGKIGGTGIGTYSASVMTRAMRGRLDMRTSDKEGTTVTLRIPLTRSPLTSAERSLTQNGPHQEASEEHA